MARMQDLSPELIRSITRDQGTDMARYLATTDNLGASSSLLRLPITWQFRFRGAPSSGATLWTPV